MTTTTAIVIIIIIVIIIQFISGNLASVINNTKTNSNWHALEMQIGADCF